MEIIVASGLVTLVGLFLLARKHRVELTAATKTQILLISVLFAAAPVVASLRALVGGEVGGVFLLLAYAASGLAWILIVWNLLNFFNSGSRSDKSLGDSD